MSYYKELGVADDATLHEIKDAYHRKALRYQPDKNPNDLYSAEKIKKINEAYNTLSNYTTRKQYDNRNLPIESVGFNIFQPMRFDSMFSNILRNFDNLETFERTIPNYSKSVSIQTTNINGKKKARKVTIENGKKKVEEYNNGDIQQFINY